MSALLGSRMMRVNVEASVRMPDGRTVTASGVKLAAVGSPAPVDDRPSATIGFGSVRWRGKLYWFDDTQRLIVAHLWEAWEAGEPFVAQSTLLDVAEVRGRSVR